MNNVSVCMATYNGGNFITQQVASILSQLPTDGELIISDDGSSDGTLHYLNNLQDKRVNVFHHKSTGHPKDNFENALTHAKGEYIFLADQDDIWMPNKIAEILKVLKSSDLVMSNALIIDDRDENHQEETLFNKRRAKRGLLSNLYKNSYTGCGLAFRRKVLEQALPFPKNIPMHDWWIALIAEKYYKTSFMEEPLFYYRQHDGNFSPNFDRAKRSILLGFYDRLCMTFALLKHRKKDVGEV